jgi:3'-phosphoadenosine 5'-phosphosulfate sulfotransferase (PAPS reductase)/FAD synthetase
MDPDIDKLKKKIKILTFALVSIGAVSGMIMYMQNKLIKEQIIEIKTILKDHLLELAEIHTMVNQQSNWF